MKLLTQEKIMLVIEVVVLVTQLCPTLCDPTNCHPPAPLSTGFSRQEYWTGLLFPSPEDIHDAGIEARSPALQADSLSLLYLCFFFIFM